MKGKRYVEKCLWEYRANLGMLEQLRYEIKNLRSVRGHSYEAHVQYGVSDAVADVVHKLLVLEKRIRRTEGDTEPVSRLHRDFEAGAYREKYMRDIFDMRYMEHQTVDYIMRALHISQPTYWRGKDALLHLAGKYFAIE